MHLVRSSAKLTLKIQINPKNKVETTNKMIKITNNKLIIKMRVKPNLALLMNSFLNPLKLVMLSISIWNSLNMIGKNSS